MCDNFVAFLSSSYHRLIIFIHVVVAIIMGLNSSTKIKWKATGLTVKSVQDLSLGRRIDVDDNALAFKMHNSNKLLSETLYLMAHHLKQLAFSGGFIITVIFDGSFRPDCKRASLNRRKKSCIDDANRFFCRFKALELSSKVEKGDSGVKEALALYNAECAKLESSCSKQLIIPENVGQLFSERLMMTEACSPNENGGYVLERVLTSAFQADALIARRFKGGLSDLIYGNDSDYFVLLGADCIMMWNMKLSKRKSGRGRKRKEQSRDDNGETYDATSLEVELYGASNEKMKKYKEKLEATSPTLPKNLNWVEAKHPFFKSFDPVFRVIVAIILGCDVYDGIKGWGPSKIEVKINDIRKKSSSTMSDSDLVPSLMSSICLAINADENVIDTLISSFIYEPGIVNEDKSLLDDVLLPGDDINTHEARSNGTSVVEEKYVHQPPDDFIFPTYLKSFDVRSQTHDNHDNPSTSSSPTQHYGPPLFQCKSFNGYRPHFFMQHEGRHQCAKCSEHFCKTCSFLPQDDKTKRKNSEFPVYYKSGCDVVLCLDCFKSTRHGENQVNDELATSSVPLERMRRILNEKVGLQLSVDDISPVEVMDMYHMYIASPTNSRDAIHLASASSRIKFPFFPSQFIDDDKKIVRVGKEPFDLTDGGRFISDPQTIPDHHISSVLNILASLLRYDEESLPQNDNVYVGKYDYLPTLFLTMAYYSRVDSGYRLLDRCARHTCDPKGPSIINQAAQFFEYEESESGKKGECKRIFIFTLLIFTFQLHLFTHRLVHSSSFFIFCFLFTRTWDHSGK